MRTAFFTLLLMAVPASARADETDNPAPTTAPAPTQANDIGIPSLPRPPLFADQQSAGLAVPPPALPPKPDPLPVRRPSPRFFVFRDPGVAPPPILDAQLMTPRRTQRVYRLRNCSAKHAAKQLESRIGDFLPSSLKNRADSAGLQVTLVPVPKTNSLIVSAPLCVAEAIAKRIAELDRDPKVHQIDLTISRTGPKQNRKVISRPRVTTFEGRKAVIQISDQSGGILEIEVQVAETAPRQQKTALPKPVAQFAPPAFDVFVQPKPATFPRRPAPALQRHRHRTIIGTAGPLPARLPVPSPIRLAGGTSATTDCPQAVSPGQLTIRRYSIADLVKQPHLKGGKPAYDTDTVVEFVRVGVEPRSWQSAGGSCSLILLKSADALIVRHHDRGHQQIDELLRALRRGKR